MNRTIQPFQKERYLATWGRDIAWNLGEIGVAHVHLRDVLEPAVLAEYIGNEPLCYGVEAGSRELRTAIANLYSSADAANVLVTHGAAEANYLVAWALLNREDEIVVTRPSYMQIPLLAQTWGVEVKTWWLNEDSGWRPTIGSLESLLTPRTKAIVICNPNNPTGTVLPLDTIDAICAIADERGLYIVVDEVLSGTESAGTRTRSFLEQYPRAIVIGGLSKAFGLPGLRVGWLVTRNAIIDRLCECRDYTTIAPSPIIDRLAQVALRPKVQARLSERGRMLLEANIFALRDWAEDCSDIVSYVPPVAGGVAFLRYRIKMSSQVLAECLRQDYGVLVVPGVFFGLDGYVRIGLAADLAVLRNGLERLGNLLRKLRDDAQVRSPLLGRPEIPRSILGLFMNHGE